MPGGAFKVNGTVSAPNRTGFNYVADRLSMVMPAITVNGGGFRYNKHVTGSFIPNWGIWNPAQQGGTNTNSVSFGAFTLAPDGTTNVAQHIAENSSTSTVHAVMAAYQSNGFNISPSYTIRHGFILKAAERTRAAIYVTGVGSGLSPPAPISGNGCKTVFDLAGVQVGVANTAFGSGVLPGATSITALTTGPNPWCLLYMDVLCSFQFCLVSVVIDQGSGTAAENTVYLGDGSSGIFGWRAVTLPPGAWQFNNRVFFDDFNDLSTIDINNTKAPGFNWYPDISNPQYGNFSGSNPICPPSALSVNSSVLTIAPYAGMLQAQTLQSVVWPNFAATPTIGRTYQGSMLVESRLSWQQNLSNNSVWTLWTTSTERFNLSLLPQQGGLGLGGDKNIEDDWFESKSGGANDFIPHRTLFGNIQVITLSNAPGYPPWYSTYPNYDTFSKVFRLGQLYVGLSNMHGMTNIPPESNPTFWQVYTPQPPDPINVSDIAVLDETVMNVMSFMKIIPSGNELGHVLTFYNNLPGSATIGNSGCHVVYGSAATQGGYNGANFTVGDSAHCIFIIGASPAGNMNIDWCSVIQ